MDHRLVKLESKLSSDRKTLTITGPRSARVYPPGPAFLYVVTEDGVPSTGHKVIIGDGQSPPVDEDAIAKYVIFMESTIHLILQSISLSMLAHPADNAAKKVQKPSEGEGSENI
jgi:hypothetical protein